MSTVKIVNLDRDTKKLLYVILGIVAIILGSIVIFDYLMAFFRLLLGLGLIILGLALIFKTPRPFGRVFFRF